MANISIKDVPDVWAEALRQRAARNHRSLQGELMAVIEATVAQESDANANHSPKSASSNPRTLGTVVGFDRFGHPITRQGWKTVQQVAAEMRVKFPEPITDAALGVDIIRAERDSR